MKKIIITGITGMIGTALSDYLKGLGYEVSGISRATSDARQKNYQHFLGDVLDNDFLKKTWRSFRPDIVFHLAAQAYNGESYRAEDSTYLINIQGTRNVLNVCRDYSPNARLIPACSSAAYGFTDKQPITEDAQLRPITPYGVTKATCEMMFLQYMHNYSMDVVIPRLFITLGVNHPPYTLVQNLARQFAAYTISGKEPLIHVGNLTTLRDYVDSYDVVRALYVLMDNGDNGGVYNVCGQFGYSAREIVEIFEMESGIKAELVHDKALLRPSDEPVLVGDNSRLKNLGWHKKKSISESIHEIYENWILRLT